MTHEEFIAKTHHLVVDALREHTYPGLTDKVFSIDDLLYHFHTMDRHLQGEGDLFLFPGVYLNTEVAQKILLQAFSYITQMGGET